MRPFYMFEWMINVHMRTVMLQKSLSGIPFHYFQEILRKHSRDR